MVLVGIELAICCAEASVIRRSGDNSSSHSMRQLDLTRSEASENLERSHHLAKTELITKDQLPPTNTYTMIKAQRATFAESADSDMKVNPKVQIRNYFLQEKPRKASESVDGIQSDLKEIKL